MLCKMLIPIFLSTFLAAQQSPVRTQRSAHHPRNWERLKRWANEYPATPVGCGTRKVNIFKDPEVHRVLLNLLGRSNYKRLMEDFQREALIDVIDGNIVLEGWTNPHLTEREEFALVIFRISNGQTNVVFSANGQIEWYPANQGEPELPKCIHDRVIGAPFE